VIILIIEVNITTWPANSPSASISKAIVKDDTAVGEAVTPISATKASLRNPRAMATPNTSIGKRMSLPRTTTRRYFKLTLILLNWKVPPSTTKARGVATLDRPEIGDKINSGIRIRSINNRKAIADAMIKGFLIILRNTFL
jgi:hypothetical protein